MGLIAIAWLPDVSIQLWRYGWVILSRSIVAARPYLFVNGGKK